MTAPDEIILHPTPSPDLWAVAAVRGDTIAPVCGISRSQPYEAWEVPGTELTGPGVLDVYLAVIREVAALDVPPPTNARECEQCRLPIPLDPGSGLVWRSSTGIVSPPLSALFDAGDAHRRECDVALGWLTAAGWLAPDEVDRRSGPFTPDAWKVALQDAAAFLTAVPSDLLEVYVDALEGNPLPGNEASAHERVGHDLYLTQHHHGVGFWSRTELGLPSDLTDVLCSYAWRLPERNTSVTEGGEVDVE